jgi:cysteinyl-tRNA synthetase
MAELREVSGNKVSTEIEKMVNETEKRFTDAMDDDLNISLALAAVFDLMSGVNKAVSSGKIGKANAERVYGLMLQFDTVLGLKLESSTNVWKKPGDAPTEIATLIEKRESYRKDKDWEGADGIRNELGKRDIEVQDTADGPRWRKA